MSVLLSQVIVGLVSAIGGWLAKVIHNWYVAKQQTDAIQTQNETAAAVVKETGRPT